MKAAQTVLWSQLVLGGKDRHGNRAETYADAAPLAVFGWAPGGSTEPRAVGEDRIVSDLDVYSPSTYGVSARDRMMVDGLLYDLTGEPQDWRNGPFGYRPGAVFNLKRVTG